MNALAVVVAALLTLSTPAHAVFHLAEIAEAMSGISGDPTVQFVEIRMKAGLQNSVAHTRLTAFDCAGTTATVLLEVPGNVANGGVDVRWLMASPSAHAFMTAFGVTPDFTFSGSIDPTCGNLCWGAPGIVPQNPPAWDPAVPSNYVDCLAYGGYSGILKAGQPVVAGPLGDGVHGLARTIGTTTFAPACPTPESDAGALGALAACSGTTVTTTTTPHASTTSTTLPLSACLGMPAVADVRAQIEATCPCTAATSHRAYVRCAASVLGAAAKAGALPKACKGAIRHCLAGSICGRPGTVTCCRRTAKGVLHCGVKKSAGACKAPTGGAACASAGPSCCDTCSGDFCPLGTTTPATSVTTTTRHRRPPPTQPPYMY